MELKNRVVMSAIGTHESVESEGGKSVIDKLIAYHVARAKGGNGLNAVDEMINDVEESNIEVHLNTESSLELISNMKPDALIIAIGSSPFILPIQGADKCIIAHDVLSEKVNVKGENVVIIGGGLVGFETAEFLASQGKKITILEMKEKALQDLGRFVK